jgi:serine/threonine-protein kinase HipA
MGRRSHTRELGLWMNGIEVGTWSISPSAGDTLRYADAWTRSEQGRPISLSLPFTPGNAPHRGAKVAAYFENLLPDSKSIRERVARRFHTGSVEPFDLLTEIGRDCAGALQILQRGDAPLGVTTLESEPLTDARVAQVLRGAVTSGPPGLRHDEDDFRISIAGAQEKTALLRVDDQWCMPHGTTPTTHILKLPLGLAGGMRLDLSESVENEWLCSVILKAYGLPVATCECVQFDDMKALAVERFDRTWWRSGTGDSWIVRLPQEDMCQAKGLPPQAKYEADGGPGIDSILASLEGSMARDEDRLTFFQAQVIYGLLCAPDGHAKNFSVFLRPGGRYQLTPLYDVLSAYPVLGDGPGKLSPFKVKLAMAVRSKNAHWRVRDIVRRHWLAVGTRHGIVSVDGRGAQYVIDDLVARTPGVVETVRKALPRDFPEQLADSILTGLQAAANKLAG